jgi:hypothetical protein
LFMDRFPLLDLFWVIGILIWFKVFEYQYI